MNPVTLLKHNVTFIVKKFSRKEILKLIGLTGIAAFSSTLFNKVYGANIKNTTDN